MNYKSLIALILSLSAPFCVATSQAASADAARAHAPISNVIVFGDSYSDIGNFPEASSTLTDPNKPMKLSNLTSMVYVPVVNPVNLQTPNVNVHHYPVPNLAQNHLPPQPTLDGKKRAFRSVSWTEFLTTDLYADHYINSPNITPSVSVDQSVAPFANINMSVNYAWASATSRASCTYYVSFDRVADNLCNEQNILQARKNYLRDPSNANLAKIIVPGMRRQIELFFSDLQAKKVAVNAHTNYVLEIGGNDLLAAGKHFQIANTRTMASNVYYGAYRVLSSVPGHVYIFTFANPDLTPYAGAHPLLGKLAASVVNTYNKHLQAIVAQLNQAFPGRVSLVDEHQIFQNFAATVKPEFFHQACQLNPTPNCHGYQYWNEVHPTSDVEAVFGYDVAKQFEA